jgi:hypothetical protein
LFAVFVPQVARDGAQHRWLVVNGNDHWLFHLPKVSRSSLVAFSTNVARRFLFPNNHAIPARLAVRHMEQFMR